MRKAVLATIVAMLFTLPPAVAGEEIRWIAFVRGERGEFTGSLEVVRTDGEGARTIIESGVLAADVGPDGIVYAAVETGPPEDEEVLPPSELLKANVEEGQPEPAIPAERKAYYLAVSASAQGDIAFLRDVTRKAKIPKHLRPAIESLRATALPVLAPPDEPPDTGSVVADGEEDFYLLRFTNDPQDELSHAEQVNVFVQASTERDDSFKPMPVEVRGRQGRFSCGASTCFLSWKENGVFYTVGEFGDPDEAAGFAESLKPMEALAGVFWQIEGGRPLPELIVRTTEGEHRTLESVREFCECAFAPVAWHSRGRRLLVITSAEGYTVLQEYRGDGSRQPKTITEGSLLQGGEIVDADYGPEGIIILITGEGGPPGRLQSVEGDRIVPGRVRGFDIQGSTLAYVTGRGEVVVRDLTSRQEEVVARGAIGVSLAPDIIPVAEPAPPGTAVEEGLPELLVVLISVAAFALITGATLLLVARRRRRAAGQGRR